MTCYANPSGKLAGADIIKSMLLLSFFYVKLSCNYLQLLYTDFRIKYILYFNEENIDKYSWNLKFIIKLYNKIRYCKI